MEMKPGYKQTEVGVIPEDWRIKQVRDLKPFVTSGSRGWAAYYSDRGSPFIRITNLSRETIDLDLQDLCFVSLKASDGEASRTQLRDGDVLISITADIGIIGYVSPKVPKPAYINQHIALMRFDPGQSSSRFISYFLASSQPQRLFRALTDSGAKAGMNLTTVQQVHLALPPTKTEQDAITQALSDADALIDSLEQLIAKKRHLKQGAMQELLTGKKRLPDFSGEWMLKSMSELAGGDENVVDGPFGSNLKNSDYTPTGVPVLQGLNITGDNFVWKEVRYISNRKARDLFRSNAQVGDLLTVKIGSVGFSALIDDLEGHPFAIIPANLLRVRFRNGASDPRFVHYALTSDCGKKALKDLAANTAQPALSLTGFRKLAIRIPGNTEEQTAIAIILSDMDAEIAALETKLAKARQLKQGMMQELLTGKVRLV